MGDVVSLRRARKAKARAGHATAAAANRVLHGRTKGERGADAAAKARLERSLDGAKREP